MSDYLHSQLGIDPSAGIDADEIEAIKRGLARIQVEAAEVAKTHDTTETIVYIKTMVSVVKHVATIPFDQLQRLAGTGLFQGGDNSQSALGSGSQSQPDGSAMAAEITDLRQQLQARDRRIHDLESSVTAELVADTNSPEFRDAVEAEVSRRMAATSSLDKATIQDKLNVLAARLDVRKSTVQLYDGVMNLGGTKSDDMLWHGVVKEQLAEFASDTGLTEPRLTKVQRDAAKAEMESDDS